MPSPRPGIRTSSLTPDYAWNEKSGRYINVATGRYVSASVIRDELDRILLDARAETYEVTRQLIDDEINLIEWQLQMEKRIKTIHVVSAALALGGWAAMTAASWGKVGALIKAQYRYLDRFAREIESGKQKLDGSARVRAGMYAEAGRATHEAIRQQQRKAAGDTEERRVLGVADHCDDCVAEAAKGWQPIGTLRAIGDSKCKTHCHCKKEYR